MLKEILVNYWWIILVVLGFVVYEVIKYKKISKIQGEDIAKEELIKDIRETVYKLMFLAEDKWGNGKEGSFKFAWVVESLYKLFPDSLKEVLGEDKVEETVQEWYIKAKDLLDDGKINNSVTK